ncbi:MAG TPA: hypothetical protein VK992_02195 [Candidatus Caenarcaniphilales bacterium]|nr:hypothetical protein [Candidatus Caenarcaniphilales bacterium]
MEEHKAPGWLGEDRSRHDEGPATGDEEGRPAPVDLRDTYGNAGPAIGDAAATVAVDVDMPEGGAYPLPDEVQRPYQAQDPGSIHQPTVDPSLSRAVDRAAAGLDPEAYGYDRTAEGAPPGPLAPDAPVEDADGGPQPAGQWGSSGSTP